MLFIITVCIYGHQLKNLHIIKYIMQNVSVFTSIDGMMNV